MQLRILGLQFSRPLLHPLFQALIQFFQFVLRVAALLNLIFQLDSLEMNCLLRPLALGDINKGNDNQCYFNRITVFRLPINQAMAEPMIIATNA